MKEPEVDHGPDLPGKTVLPLFQRPKLLSLFRRFMRLEPIALFVVFAWGSWRDTGTHGRGFCFLSANPVLNFTP